MQDDRLAFNRRAVRPLDCVGEGWQLIKDDYWLFLGISFVGLLIARLVPFAIMVGPMMCGIYLCLLRQQQRRQVSFEVLFDGFNYFAQSLIATMLFVIPFIFFIAAWYVLFFIALFGTIANLAPQGQGPPQDPGMFVAAILGIEGVFFLGVLGMAVVLSVLEFFMYQLIVDRELTGTEAAVLSMKAAFANLGGVLAVILLEMVFVLIGFLFCGVGVIFVTPLCLAMVSIAYRQVFPLEDRLQSLRPESDGRDDDDDGPDARTETGIQTEPKKRRADSHVKER